MNTRFRSFSYCYYVFSELLLLIFTTLDQYIFIIFCLTTLFYYLEYSTKIEFLACCDITKNESYHKIFNIARPSAIESVLCMINLCHIVALQFFLSQWNYYTLCDCHIKLDEEKYYIVVRTSILLVQGRYINQSLLYLRGIIRI